MDPSTNTALNCLSKCLSLLFILLLDLKLGELVHDNL